MVLAVDVAPPRRRWCWPLTSPHRAADGAGPAMARFLNALGTKGLRFKRKTGGWSARCPAHSDQHQSLSIDQGEKGVTLKCFTGCANDSIVAAVGLTMKDLFDDTPGDSTTRERRQQEPEGQRTLTATYQYGDGAGKVLAEKGRFELPGGKKTFLWR
ncbi:MAG: hypothetical protein NTZ05_08070, partial [Chloroflexi bacterium]|nr:hypothetical protein [Chloroflexota bacterium]